ncbi:hypothetical protein EOD39_7849 [Acipenser ruthenus]|uniref:Uncharacterized protein n=1 Tax=Acipenser ruthenus TaxID=7906 RepID=A0A444U5S3_ACIRT|nr:hypothetical protein EOD39_7849 [Acipenser ruthenus]
MACRRLFKSLANLQYHAEHSFKEGLSCRVFFKKMIDIQEQRKMNRSEDTENQSSCYDSRKRKARSFQVDSHGGQEHNVGERVD